MKYLIKLLKDQYTLLKNDINTIYLTTFVILDLNNLKDYLGNIN